MGLDATVYCDCFERGLLQIPPPAGITVLVSEDGSLYHTGGPTADEAFDSWYWTGGACPHKHFILLHHRLGNIATVGWMRGALKRLTAEPQADYPVLWNQVIYSGSHCGDYLDLTVVDCLRTELDRLRLPEDWRYPEPDGVWARVWRRLVRSDLSAAEADQAFFESFVGKLQGLVYAALWFRKPISF